MNMLHLRVKTRLMLGFAVLAAIVVIVSALSMRSLGRSNERFTNYLEGVGQRERLATDIRGSAMRRAIAARNLVLVTTPADREMEKVAVTKAHDEVQVLVRRLRDMVAAGGDVSDTDRRMVGEIEKVEAKYGPLAQEIGGLALKDQQAAAIAKMNAECRPLLAALLKATGDLIEYEQAQAASRVKAAEDAYAADRLLLILVSVAAAAGAIVMGWLLSNSVTRPLTRAVALAESVAAGDLSSDIVIDTHDETGALLGALKKMNVNLGAMVSRVRQSADGIATASAEIATGNSDLSNRTEQQAAALQQTAASMQQMTSSVQQSADNSRQAVQLAASAAEVAGRGGEVVDRVVSTMGEISASSKKIAEIIGVIDGIAFQTNILALNAAVEAARAGEQGRGFAVVAGEVRSLAQRSAQAAREIKDLIVASVEKVDDGSRLVGDAGSTMHDIVAQVRRMSDLVGEISSAATEQNADIGQVNRSVASIDQGTQQNAALVEQSAAAAESLREQASGLLQLVAEFKTR